MLSPSLDEIVALSTPMTVDDFKAFQELLKMMTETLEISLELMQGKPYTLFPTTFYSK